MDTEKQKELAEPLLTVEDKEKQVPEKKPQDLSASTVMGTLLKL